VGHHGSNDAVSAGQLEAMQTKLALISCGVNNRYGHPTAQTLALLEDAGVAICRTDLNGDITVSFAPASLQVSCAKMSPEVY
jgi:competence protein ComEC